MEVRFLGGLIIAICLFSLLWGCGPPKGQVGRQPPPKPEDYPKLSAQLFELATAEKPSEYAARHPDLKYKDGLVQVVIEVQGPEWVEDLKWAVESLGGQLETSYETLVQARVPLEALLKLAKHPRVNYIRPPVRPRPA